MHARSPRSCTSRSRPNAARSTRSRTRSDPRRVRPLEPEALLRRRLAYALEGWGNDVTLADLARLCDVFYIGGTKCGSLLGVRRSSRSRCAAVFLHAAEAAGRRHRQGPRRGDSVWSSSKTTARSTANGRTGVRTAQKLQDAFIAKGFRIDAKSPTNQVFGRSPRTLPSASPKR